MSKNLYQDNTAKSGNLIAIIMIEETACKVDKTTV